MIGTFCVFTASITTDGIRVCIQTLSSLSFFILLLPSLQGARSYISDIDFYNLLFIVKLYCHADSGLSWKLCRWKSCWSTLSFQNILIIHAAAAAACYMLDSLSLCVCVCGWVCVCVCLLSLCVCMYVFMWVCISMNACYLPLNLLRWMWEFSCRHVSLRVCLFMSKNTTTTTTTTILIIYCKPVLNLFTTDRKEQ